MLAAEGGIDSVYELVGGEQAGGLGDALLVVDPLGLDGFEPGARDRQQASDDPDAAAALVDAAIVGANPDSYRPADVPGRIVPNQRQRLLARLEPGAAPGQIFDRHGVYRAAVDEAQPDYLPPAALR